jgi:hypothetical protein
MGKVKFTLQQTMKAQRREERYSSTLSLTTALDGVDGQRHDPAAFSPRERICSRCIGGWVDPRTGLDGCGKSRLTGMIRLPDRPAHSAVAIPTELSRPTCIYGYTIKLQGIAYASSFILAVEA